MHEIRNRRIKHYWIRFFYERLWPLSHSWPLFFQTLTKKCRSCDDEGAYVLHKCALTPVFEENARRKYGREFSSVSVLTLSGTTCTARQLLVNTLTLVDTHGWWWSRAGDARLEKGQKPLPLNGFLETILAGKLLNCCQSPSLFSWTNRYHFIANVCKSSTLFGDFLLVASFFFSHWDACLILFRRIVLFRIFICGNENGNREMKRYWFFGWVENWLIFFDWDVFFEILLVY